MTSPNDINPVGMIHLACYCGADLFYLGNSKNGPPTAELLQNLSRRLGSGDYGFFSSADGRFGSCPHCGLLFELPDPELLSWLPFLDENSFEAMITKILHTGREKSPRQLGDASTRGYLI